MKFYAEPQSAGKSQSVLLLGLIIIVPWVLAENENRGLYFTLVSVYSSPDCNCTVRPVLCQSKESGTGVFDMIATSGLRAWTECSFCRLGLLQRSVVVIATIGMAYEDQ